MFCWHLHQCFLTVCSNEKPITPPDSLGNTLSICIYKHPNTFNITIMKAILSTCIFIINSAILKWKWGCAKSLDFALCKNEVGALSANQNAGLQCKINTAVQNQLILHWVKRGRCSLSQSKCRITVQNQHCKSRSGRITYTYVLVYFMLLSISSQMHPMYMWKGTLTFTTNTGGNQARPTWVSWVLLLADRAGLLQWADFSCAF